MSKTLVFALQYEEGETGSGLDGVVGIDGVFDSTVKHGLLLFSAMVMLHDSVMPVIAHNSFH